MNRRRFTVTVNVYQRCAGSGAVRVAVVEVDISAFSAVEAKDESLRMVKFSYPRCECITEACA